METTLETRMQLVSMLSSRMRAMISPDVADEANLSDFLQFEAKLPAKIANRISWADFGSGDDQITNDDIASIAKSLEISPQLLKCFIVPTSDEYLLHVLKEVVPEQMNISCDICDELEDQIIELENPDSDDLYEIAMIVLDHLVVKSDSENANFEVRPLMERLIEVASELEEDAVRRVLAYAMQESAKTTDGKEALSVSAVAKFRDAHLTSFQINVFNTISEQDDYEIDAHKLREILGLRDVRDLMKLENDIAAALCSLESSGYRWEGSSPLMVERDGNSFVLSMDIEFGRIWRAISQSANTH